jgi:hypothetical protein
LPIKGDEMRKAILLQVAIAVLAMSLHPAAARGTAEERQPVTTTAPDLRSVEILDGDPYDGETELVEYCFDQDVAESVTPSGFTLVGYNSAVTIAASTATRAGSSKCVDARFANGLDIAPYSLGVVLDGAVKGSDNHPNAQGASVLAGSKITSVMGDTTLPQLIDARSDPDNDQVTFVFDESLDPTVTKPLLPALDLAQPASPHPSKFLIYAPDGTQQAATDVVAIEKDSIVLQFAKGSVKNAVRFAVSPDTCPPPPTTSPCAGVADRQQPGRAGQKNPYGAVGKETSVPELTRAVRLPHTSQIDFVFDEVLTSATAGSFLAYTQDGSAFPASRAVLRGSDQQGTSTVRATFPIIGFSDKIVSVAVAPAAVMSADSNKGNTIGSAAIAKSYATPGATDAPDLVGVVVEAQEAAISFYFDREVDKKPSPSAFRMVDADGLTAAGQEIIDQDDRMVTVGFQGSSLDVANAVAATVNAGAAKDLQGKGAPITTLAPGSAAAAEAASEAGGGGSGSSGGSNGGGGGSATSTEPPADIAFLEDSTGVIDHQQRLSVRVTDQAGVPVEGAAVEFSSSGVGSIVSADQVSNDRGIARAVVISSEPGEQDVTATASDCVDSSCEDTGLANWVERANQLNCTLVGTTGDDVLHASRKGDVVCAFGGDDVVYGSPRRDVIQAGPGNDSVRGGRGSDVLRGASGEDLVEGGKGNDVLFGGRGSDALFGNRGHDRCHDNGYGGWFAC